MEPVDQGSGRQRGDRVGRHEGGALDESELEVAQAQVGLDRRGDQGGDEPVGEGEEVGAGQQPHAGPGRREGEAPRAGTSHRLRPRRARVRTRRRGSRPCVAALRAGCRAKAGAAAGKRASSQKTPPTGSPSARPRRDRGGLASAAGLRFSRARAARAEGTPGAPGLPSRSRPPECCARPAATDGPFLPDCSMDQAKLAALRARYLDATGGDIDDPDFAKAARQQFSESDRRKWPFADVATFLDLPYRPDAATLPDFGGLDVALIGVPMDLGVTNRAGARHGPRAVRAVERVGPYEHVLRMTPAAELKAADIGDVPFRSRFSLESCHEDIEDFFATVVKAGVVPLAVGGDHSISRATLRAVGASRPVGMIHIDAHCDTAASTRARSSTTAGRSARRCSTACSIRRARSRSASARRRRVPVGVLLRFRHDRDPCRGGGAAARASRGDRPGPRGRGRRAHLPLLRRRQPRSGLRPGHRHARDGRAHAPARCSNCCAGSPA